MTAQVIRPLPPKCDAWSVPQITSLDLALVSDIEANHGADWLEEFLSLALSLFF